MRRLSIVLIAVVLTVAACSTSGDDAPVAGESRTASSGEIEITATPASISDAAVTFRLVFDTHSGSLDFDPVEIATVDVAGSRARAMVWDGPGAGGHHREGELRFAAGGPLAGVSLELALDPPVTFSWGAGD